MRETVTPARLAAIALQAAGAHKQRGYEAAALWLSAEIAAAALEGERAEADYQHAMVLASEIGLRPLMAHCHLGLGKLHRRTGKAQEAQEPLSIATTMYREMDMKYWLEQAQAEMGA